MRRALKVLHALREAVYVRGPDYSVEYMNPAAERVAGLSFEVAQTKRCYEVFGDEGGRCRDHCPADHALRSGEAVSHLEGTLIDAHGVAHRMSVSVSPVRDPELANHAVFVMNELADLETERASHLKARLALEAEVARRRELEFTLRASEERQRQLLSTLGAVIWEAYAGSLDISYVSPQAELLAGYSLEDWCTPGFRLRSIDERDRSAVEEALRDLRPVGKQMVLEYRMKHRTGAVIWVRDQIVSRTDGDGRSVLRGVLLDVTLEKRDRLLAEEAAQAAKVGGFQYVAPHGDLVLTAQAREVLGDRVTSAGGLRALEPAVVNSSRQAIEHAISRLAEGADSFECELELQPTDSAGVRIVKMVGRRENDSLGGLSRVYGSVQCVTDRRRLERELRAAAKMEAIGRVAGGIAHDFNNLVMTINGFAEEIVRADSLDKARNDAREIQGAGKRAAELTRQLLTFSRGSIADSGSCALNGVVEEVVRMLRRVSTPLLDIEMRLSPEVKSVPFDAGKAQQVLLNLMLNARDAMPGGGLLTVETDLIGPPGNGLPTTRLRVSDQGAGMTPEVRDRALEPFFTTKQDGTGMGLAVVFGLVRQVGGSLAISSEQGRGTTVEVNLPTVAADPVPVEVAPRAQDQDSKMSARILLAEDDPRIRSLLTRVLSRAGYTVASAEDGEQAFQMLKGGERPDLLLTDLRMPRMDGLTLATLARSICPAIPVILMSGLSEDHSLEGELASLPLLRKPMSSEVVIDAVASLLAQRGAGLPVQ